MVTATLSSSTFSPFDFAFRIPTPPRSAARHVVRMAEPRPSTLLPRLRFGLASITAAASMWLALAAPWFLVASQ